MGIYLNPDNRAFTKSYKNPLYVDKSLLIQKMNRFIDIDDCFVCVARPRRFGKSVDANMLTAYYSKGCDSSSLFDNLKISQTDDYKEHLNNHNVIYLNMLYFFEDSDSVEDMKSYIRDDVVDELKEEYHVESNRNTLPSILRKIYKETKDTFIFIIDEWDCVLRDNKFSQEERKTYLRFLNSIFKDSIYISLVYMTGILPIKKYGTQSSLSMFKEITMINPTPFEEFMGFTEAEVKELCNKHQMDFSELKSWYDGYHIGNLSLYNPRSIVFSISDRKYDSYWTNTETYESLKIYFDENMDGIKEGIISLIAGEGIVIDPLSFENDMTVYNSKDDIFTLLVHLGYLGYNLTTSEVYIPNREVKAQFEIALKDSHWKELDNAIQNSINLLHATWNMDEEKVAYYIEEAHLGISHLKYNCEEALAHTVDIAYFAARGYYKKLIELQTGNGFCDIAYIPKTDKPALLVELKWQDNPETAINQIKKKKYYKGLEDYYDNLLLVGITYQKDVNKDDYKEHYCKIEKYHVKEI
ncbi:MAG: ATP-binding protein [Erysipelotrichaceae bacterium]|nr:ATP-binding protein [Erysipelotrichaceae bacterium]